jgi:hypothetical protein
MKLDLAAIQSTENNPYSMHNSTLYCFIKSFIGRTIQSLLSTMLVKKKLLYLNFLKTIWFLNNCSKKGEKGKALSTCIIGITMK